MEEIVEFVNTDGGNLFTVVHQPVDKDETKAFIFVHPFAEEKLWSHRVYVSFARELAMQGYYVIRFDLLGHGDSGGDFIDSTVEGNLNNIDSVVEHVTNLYNITEINLFGLRLGATLAALYAANNDRVNSLLLWDPIISGDRYMQEILRSNLATQMAIKGKVELTRDDLIKQMKDGRPINVEGYLLTYEYFSQLSDIDLLNVNYNDHIKCYINQIVRNIKQPLNKPNQELIKRFNHQSVLEKAHEEQFWKEIKTFYQEAKNLTTASIDWLIKRQ